MNCSEILINHFQNYFFEQARLFDQILPVVLSKTSITSAPKSLRKAIEYSLFAGGKRFRPVLALETAKVNGLSSQISNILAVSLECLHTYSLIHDDLPAMDDDDMRRGQLSSHKVFGEDVAILVGDSLQALSIELISQSKSILAIRYFTKRIGPAGMVGGQFLDIASDSQIDPSLIHTRKTGELIAACVTIPMIVAGFDLKPAHKWGSKLGKLFQITDDILDVIAKGGKLGKTSGKDVLQNKITYVSKYGMEQSQKISETLAEELSLLAEKIFPGSKFHQLIPKFILERQS